MFLFIQKQKIEWPIDYSVYYPLIHYKMASSVISSIMIQRAGIKKQQHVYKFSSLIDLLRDGKIKSHDWNRSEVTNHPGSGDDLMKSMAMGWCISMFVGYWNGTAVGKPAGTKENPIRITEGGHRTRWLKDIADGKATLDNISLNRLKDLHPEVYQVIMDYKIVIEITTHTSGIVPENYVKGEYRAVNTRGSTLTVGETLRASTDQPFLELKKQLEAAYANRKAKMDKQARDKATEIYAAIIKGITMGSDFMKTKKDALLDKELLLTDSNITPEKFARAESIIKVIAEIENLVYCEHRANPDAKKFLEEKVTLEAYGPIIHQLSISSEEEFPSIIENVKMFYAMSLSDKDTRKANIERLKSDPKKTGNGGGRLTKERYAHGWGQLMAIITPVEDGDADDSEHEEVLEAE